MNKLTSLAWVLALTTTASAKALMIAPPPGAQRVAMADAVILGKVIRLEPKTVFAPLFPGDKEKREFVIAVVAIDEALAGANGLKEVRVGFLAPPPPAPNPGAGPVIRLPMRRYPQATLAVDQEVCLFLSKHHEEPIYTLPAYYDVISKKDNANFAKEMESIKTASKLLADPRTGLASKSADERFLTAALLLTRYQPYKPGQTKQEPIAAEESKQILLALADADWTNRSRELGTLTPQALFSRLPNKTGWTQPKDFKQFPEEARKWLKANAETYRVQKFVSEKPSEK